MPRCENCDAAVRHVWHEWNYEETTTHWTRRWVCAGCHPALPASLARERGLDDDVREGAADVGA